MNETHKSAADEKFEKLISVLIASVAILVALTAFLQNYASNLSDQATRRAQALALQSTTKQISGAIQFSYDWQGAFQTWRELHLQMIAAEQAGDEPTAERYRRLKDRIAELSPLLGPYFDASIEWPNSSQYESDLYLVESTSLSEHYTAEAAVSRAWNDTADRFVIQITLLTAALSLYGLSITLKGQMRWLFVLVGSGVVLFCMVWLGVELLRPKPTVNEQAINAYAQGVGLAYVGSNKDAIVSFNQAIQTMPDYANAYYERANAYYSYGNYKHAAEDFEAARAAGREDINVHWNLGWTYYLLGQYEDALKANDAILGDNPGVLGMRMNQALTYLAMGDLNNARSQYDLLLSEAERQVIAARNEGVEPSASLWYYMDAGANDLQNLIEELDGSRKQWTYAPQIELIRGDHQQVRAFAYEQMVRIKEVIVALEYTGQLPKNTEVMQIPIFQFGVATYDTQGIVESFEQDIDAVFPNGTDAVTVYFEYAGPLPEQPLTWKIYHDGLEDQSLRDVWIAIDVGSSNAWYKFIGYNYTNVFVLSSGEYVVELYADSRLVQRGVFYIESP